MSAARERLMDLLADRALVGLGPREQIELAELLVKVQDVDINAFDQAAAALALATLGPIEPIPAALAARIEKRAMASSEMRARPASDFASTRELDKLSPNLAQTQMDEVFEPPPAEIVSSDLVSNDFKNTFVMDDRPQPVAAMPASSPTLDRPNDPYARAPARISAAPTLASPPELANASPIPPPVTAPPSAQAPLAMSGQPRVGSVPSAPALVSSPPPMQFSSAPRMPVATHPPTPSNVVPLQRPAAKGPSKAIAIGGWLTAAACLLLAIGAYKLRPPAGPVATLPTTPIPTPTQSQPTEPPPPPSSVVASLTPAELRAKLLAAEGTARADWSPTKDPLGKSATGEVVWNKEQQKGVMRFSGLAKNDPSRAQYQLWIFDKTRDEKYPVDGGVFDVDSDTGDVIVPIKATLPVNAPVLFAVTLEKPGGVVVSKREHLVVTAKMPAG
jgi:hypothetical protein